MINRERRRERLKNIAVATWALAAFGMRYCTEHEDNKSLTYGYDVEVDQTSLGEPLSAECQVMVSEAINDLEQIAAERPEELWIDVDRLGNTYPLDISIDIGRAKSREQIIELLEKAFPGVVFRVEPNPYSPDSIRQLEPPSIQDTRNFAEGYLAAMSSVPAELYRQTIHTDVYYWPTYDPDVQDNETNLRLGGFVQHRPKSDQATMTIGVYNNVQDYADTVAHEFAHVVLMSYEDLAPDNRERIAELFTCAQPSDYPYGYSQLQALFDNGAITNCDFSDGSRCVHTSWYGNSSYIEDFAEIYIPHRGQTNNFWCHPEGAETKPPINSRLDVKLIATILAFAGVDSSGILALG
ncbi:hypothetical protein KC878_02415 [Candidatus Saccharibacteria bacterium]|nr:hypothetical protein [Candidatus Saccharibacteria bacterium]MCB9821353.1 hypothetical protein [Candidatus Nomurabacteria bacterium]